MSSRLLPSPTEEQRMMVDALGRLIDAVCPMPRLRARIDGTSPGDTGLLAQLGELGCFALLAPARHGGTSVSGNGVLDAAVIAAERGGRLQPGPFVATSVVIDTLGALATTAAHDAALALLSAGAAGAAWVGPDQTGSTLGAKRDDDGFVLTGDIPAVLDLDQCRWLLVTPALDGPAVQLLVPLDSAGLSRTARENFDLTRRSFDVHFDGVVVSAGEALGVDRDLDAVSGRQVALAAVLTAAESVGAMDANLALAVAYAGTRTAFGRPIGSFQAVKHLLANCALHLEMAKGLVTAAALAVGTGADDSAALAGAAKAFVADQGLELTQSCFQVFGGIGFTWEHDEHLYLRRLASEAHLYGGATWHRRRIWANATTVACTDGSNVD